MRQKAFLFYLLIQFVVIGFVILFFKIIPDRQWAAFWAGMLFLVSPLLVAVDQFRRAKFRERLFFVGVLQFLLLFAVPILGLRLMNWGESFDQLSIFGLSGIILHKLSSKSYIIMMVLTFRAWLLSCSRGERS
jgi:hypothetical protein